MKLVLTLVLFGLSAALSVADGGIRSGGNLRDLAVNEGQAITQDLTAKDDEAEVTPDNLRRDLATLPVNNDNCREYGQHCQCNTNMEWAALGYTQKLSINNKCSSKRKFYVKYFKYKNEDEIQGPITRSKVIKGNKQWSRIDNAKLGVDCVKVKHCNPWFFWDCTSWKTYSCSSSGSTCAAFNHIYDIDC